MATWGLWLILPLGYLSGYLSLLAQGFLAHPSLGERPEETFLRVYPRDRGRG